MNSFVASINIAQNVCECWVAYFPEQGGRFGFRTDVSNFSAKSWTQWSRVLAQVWGGIAF